MARFRVSIPINLRQLMLATLILGFGLWCRPTQASTLATYSTGDTALDTCRANLTRDNVRMFWRDAAGNVLGSVDSLREWLAKRGETLACATNGGIYGTDLRPIGLYIEGGSLLHPLNTRKGAYGNFYLQPNGVFMLLANEAVIVATDVLAASFDTVTPAIQYATQSGPILVSAGRINPLLTPGSTNRVVRNAVCVLSSTEIALVRSRAPINFYDLARVMRDAMGCRDALLLDGSVSRLYPYDADKLGAPVGPLIAVTVKSNPQPRTK